MSDATIITIATAILGTIQTLGTLWIRQIVNKNACNGTKCQEALKSYFTAQHKALSDALQSKSTPIE